MMAVVIDVENDSVLCVNSNIANIEYQAQTLGLKITKRLPDSQ